MMSIGLHCRIIGNFRFLKIKGRPGRAAELEKFLEYVSTFDDVWVCTREEIAKHWRDKFPFGKAVVEH
jgi:hypothetical protein